MTAIVAFGWRISADTLVIGALTGLTYAVLAAGLVLVYRATKVVNFAHGEVGAFGAAILAKLVLDDEWNFFVALALVLAVGAVLGLAIELGVVRRLFKAPRLIVLVATIGVAQLVFVLQLLLPGIDNTARYPSAVQAKWEVAGVLLRGEDLMVLATVPFVMIALGLFLNRTRFGLAIRAAADNPDRAELAGISTRRVSTMVWVLAGVLAVLTAVLINPLRGTVVGIPSQALGPGLLLRALTAGLIGRLTSLPLALVGGVAIGMIEALLFVNVASPGAVDLVLFLLVLVLVWLRAEPGREESASWSLAPKVAALPARLRALSRVGVGASLVVALLVPLVFTTAARQFLFSRVLVFALIALSVTVLTGWAGQLSLGQFAFVGLGAMTTAGLQARGIPLGVAGAYATVAGVVVAFLIGFPALRVRGLFLAVTTLAFAVAARGWILTQPVFLGDSPVVFVPRGTAFGIDFSSERAFYYVCLAVLVVAAAAVARLRSTGVGRSMIAVRENELAAASFTVAPAWAKLSAFAVAGGLAALGGALLAALRVQFGADAFGPEQSLQIVAMTIIGGLGSVAGAVLGALYVVGLPALLGNSITVQLATSGIGLLVLLLYLPGGLVQLLHGARARLLARLPEPPAPALPAVPAVPAVPAARATLGERPRSETQTACGIRAVDVTVRFGGRVALQQVSVEARPGEVVGLIGSNGAGKSTLLNVISGFQPTVGGRIELDDVDVTGLPAHERARLGLGRVFQDARLFGDLTVRETVQVALEADERSELVPSMLGLPPSRRAEAHKLLRADEAVDLLGLGRYADRFVSELSTGTRRIVEMCCLVAQGARVLLLDEPTAGVAQKETEAFGPLIKRIQAELGATIMIIEHDIPLVLSISDRVYCLAAGEVIAEGLPHDVRDDPKVVAAYLGTDERAIARSGAAVPALPAATSRRARARKAVAS